MVERHEVLHAKELEMSRDGRDRDAQLRRQIIYGEVIVVTQQLQELRSKSRARQPGETDS